MDDARRDPANARLVEVTGAVVSALHQVARDHRLTELELRQALSFLTEVGTRNEFTLLSDVMGLSVLVDDLTHGADGPGTRHNVEGPAYRPGAPLLPSPAQLCGADEPGDVLVLQGTVRSAADRCPLPNAVLDVWQTSAHGTYEHEDPAQPDFNLRGRVQADGAGDYELRTIVPGPYRIARGGPVGRLLLALGRHDWRPAHIHVRVTAPEHAPLTTMLFIPGDPWLGSDAIDAVQAPLILEMAPCPEAERTTFSSRFDFELRPLGDAPARR